MKKTEEKMDGKKILFICAANVNRSPSAEFWFSMRNPENIYDSAGSCRAACKIHGGKFVSEDQLNWADRIICMDTRNKNDLNKLFSGEFDQKIEVADIADQYSFMQLQLLFEFFDKIKI